MIERASIRFADLPDEEVDMPLGLGTGAAVIFGATGGVMEAALRTAVEKLTGEELAKLEFTDVRGIGGIKGLPQCSWYGCQSCCCIRSEKCKRIIK